MTIPLSMIAAVTTNRGIGNNNQLLFRIPDDLRRFRALTIGKTVMMGRKTFESIGRPLPDRENIVISGNPTFRPEGVSVYPSLEEAMHAAGKRAPREICIIGGAQIYAQAFPFADKLYLTVIDQEQEADAFFPEWEEDFPILLKEESGSWNDISYRFLELKRDT